MSYNSKDFSVMAYANGFTLWNYSTSDALNTVKAVGYFNDITPFARPGDMIMVSASNQSEAVESGIIAVKNIANGVVGISDLIPANASA